ncbi:hypothetical protein [Pseudomonas sp. NPDC007930]|uniref:hypothetical protein n=1 Tax=Pseudomonas sp. NPDC007930 TaxID=3364417 RepID=UPI0036E938E1
MKAYTAAAAVLAGAMALAGCSVFGGDGEKTCEVFSPASVATPSSQDNQRVQTNATGDPTGGGNKMQNCESQ